ncbi:hypothetical protein F2Q68_00042939 [Brassica cretica]|uniref:Uncharacterized protein n=1 Tax=Brassica cretica TaxID=69181 RepID=A0A8S9LR33_BRACR|nr:hypothetical protein F2Q68_00042939 [Brassica cretica]
MLQFSDRSLRLIKGSESAISDTVKSEDQRFLCVLRREKEELSGERREREKLYERENRERKRALPVAISTGDDGEVSPALILLRIRLSVVYFGVKLEGLIPSPDSRKRSPGEQIACGSRLIIALSIKLYGDHHFSELLEKLYERENRERKRALPVAISTGDDGEVSPALILLRIRLSVVYFGVKLEGLIPSPDSRKRSPGEQIACGSRLIIALSIKLYGDHHFSELLGMGIRDPNQVSV